MNVEIGRQNIIILFSNNEATQFHFWEYINRSLTFILDSHRPLICSAFISKPLNFRWNICAALALEDYTVNLTSHYLADLNPDFTKLSGVYIIYSTNKNTLSSFYRLSKRIIDRQPRSWRNKYKQSPVKWAIIFTEPIIYIYSQTMSIICLAAPLRLCELPLLAKCRTNSIGLGRHGRSA